jgi:hypothetical protein
MVTYHRHATPILADTHNSKAFKIVMRVVYDKLNLQKHSQTSFFVERKIPNSLDLFARNCTLFEYTNDIDTTTKAEFHMDALDFLKYFTNCHSPVNLFWFDPPFSYRQSNEIYQGHVNIYTDPAYVQKLYEFLPKMLRPGGLFVKWGYNTNNPMPSLLELEDVFTFTQGGNLNDVNVTIYRNTVMNFWRGYNGS